MQIMITPFNNKKEVYDFYSDCGMDTPDEIGCTKCDCVIDNKTYSIMNGDRIFNTAIVIGIFQHNESDSYWISIQEDNGGIFEVVVDDIIPF